MSVVAWIGLGSNLENRLLKLRSAVRALRAYLEIEQVSSLYETEPVGYRNQPFFLNACLRGRTRLSPVSLLEKMKGIEEGLGRRKTFPGGPRVIDLDLLLFDRSVIDTGDLILPHPRLEERGFVLFPLVEISPHFLHPRLKRELLDLWLDWKGGQTLRWLSGPGWEQGEVNRTPPILRLLSVPSTEKVTEKLAACEFPPWTAVRADSQRESCWHSPGRGLYFSLLLPAMSQGLERASLACALALEKKGISLELLWPRQLLCGGSVVGALSMHPSYNLLNLELNLHLERFLLRRGKRMSPLYIPCSHPRQGREGIFQELYLTIQHTSSLPSSSLNALWAERDSALGKIVLYEEKIRGIGGGLTEEGYLLCTRAGDLLLKEGLVRIEREGSEP